MKSEIIVLGSVAHMLMAIVFCLTGDTALKNGFYWTGYCALCAAFICFILMGWFIWREEESK